MQDEQCDNITVRDCVIYNLRTVVHESTKDSNLILRNIVLSRLVSTTTFYLWRIYIDKAIRSQERR